MTSEGRRRSRAGGIARRALASGAAAGALALVPASPGLADTGGAFGRPLALPAPEAVDGTLADLTGDTTADAVLLAPDGTLTVVPLGPGGAGTAQAFAGPGPARELVVGALDDTPGLDAAHAAGTQVVLRPAVGGAPRAVATLPSPVLRLAAGDVDGDGRTDLVAGLRGALTPLLQRADGAFEPGVAAALENGEPQDLLVADVTGDRRADVLSAVFSGSTSPVRFAQGAAGGLGPAGTLPQITLAYSATDRTGDGIADVVASAGGPVLLPGSPGGPGAPQPLDPPATQFTDVDGDGRDDAVALLRGDRDRQASIQVVFAGQDRPHRTDVDAREILALADANGDRRAEALVRRAGAAPTLLPGAVAPVLDTRVGPSLAAVRAWGSALVGFATGEDGRTRLAGSTGGPPFALRGVRGILGLPDLGPGPDGRPLAVLSDCGLTPRPCRLLAVRPAPTASARALPVRPRGCRLTAPSVWRGTLAYARRECRQRGIWVRRGGREQRIAAVPRTADVVQTEVRGSDVLWAEQDGAAVRVRLSRGGRRARTLATTQLRSERVDALPSLGLDGRYAYAGVGRPRRFGLSGGAGTPAREALGGFSVSDRGLVYDAGDATVRDDRPPFAWPR